MWRYIKTTFTTDKNTNKAFFSAPLAHNQCSTRDVEKQVKVRLV